MPEAKKEPVKLPPPPDPGKSRRVKDEDKTVSEVRLPGPTAQAGA